MTKQFVTYTEDIKALPPNYSTNSSKVKFKKKYYRSVIPITNNGPCHMKARKYIALQEHCVTLVFIVVKHNYLRPLRNVVNRYNDALYPIITLKLNHEVNSPNIKQLYSNNKGKRKLKIP